ncbi:MAG: hypothetical protein GF344_08435 [Chitinivibrionales bacterium]|nr:hypothetical protein [Chitinivibrionales bacterium]MBD3356904.1 hypothetical protein [Chitinivibrionales bacterium]
METPDTQIKRCAMGLGTPYLYERSCKVVGGSLHDNRFIVSFSKKALGADPRLRLSELTRSLAAPEPFAVSIRDGLGDASFVHVGFEEDAVGSLCKVYLENGADLRNAVETDERPRKPLLVHTAYKWCPQVHSVAAVSHYHCDPMLTLDQVIGRLHKVFGGKALPALDNWAAIMRFVNDLIDIKNFFFMEVSEADTPRQSFDLNVYDAELTVGEFAPLLTPLAQTLAVKENKWNTFLESRRDERLGHLAGGIHRSGKEFMTLYFGAEMYGDTVVVGGG